MNNQLSSTTKSSSLSLGYSGVDRIRIKDNGVRWTVRSSQTIENVFKTGSYIDSSCVGHFEALDNVLLLVVVVKLWSYYIGSVIQSTTVMRASIVSWLGASSYFFLPPRVCVCGLWFVDQTTTSSSVSLHVSSILFNPTTGPH